MTLPDTLAPGSYTLFAKADGPDAVPESNEFNNARLAFIQIGPDLTVTSLSVPTSAGAGTTIVVSDTTQSGARRCRGVRDPLLPVGGLLTGRK